MQQFGLFESAPLQLVDDREGGMRYMPRFIDPRLAQVWFAALRDGADWRSERRLMYEREVDVPRLVAHYDVDDVVMPTVLREALARVTAALNVRFNSAGLNFYRDERDSVALHNDHLVELQPGAPIALLSLGGARRMTIRAKALPRRAIHIELEPGSLLVMSHASQLTHLHGIPKSSQPAAARISVAFRQRPLLLGSIQ